MLRGKNYYLFLIIEWFLFVKPSVAFTQGCFMQNLVEIDPVVLA